MKKIKFQVRKRNGVKTVDGYLLNIKSKLKFGMYKNVLGWWHVIELSTGLRAPHVLSKSKNYAIKYFRLKKKCIPEHEWKKSITNAIAKYGELNNHFTHMGETT